MNVLVTGGTGFLGSRLVEFLLRQTSDRIRVLVRQESKMTGLASSWDCDLSRLEIVGGDLLSRQSCDAAAEGISVVYHLAAGTGTKSFPEAFRNSVVATRNLLDALVKHGCLK